MNFKKSSIDILESKFWFLKKLNKDIKVPGEL